MESIGSLEIGSGRQHEYTVGWFEINVKHQNLFLSLKTWTLKKNWVGG